MQEFQLLKDTRAYTVKTTIQIEIQENSLPCLAQLPEETTHTTIYPPENVSSRRLLRRVQTSDPPDPVLMPLTEVHWPILQLLRHMRQRVSHSSCNDHCGVCLENYVSGQECARLPCFHQFHSGCLYAWFTRGRLQCPTCRASVLR